MRWPTLAALVVATTACGKKSDPFAKVHAQMEHIRDQMCRCTDPACADKVLSESVQWYRANPEASGEAAYAEVDESGRERERTIIEATNACEATARGQAEVAVVTADAAPPTPPDASTAESIHGYCELQWTGTMTGATRVGMEPRWVGSDYWLSAETKRNNAKVDEDIKRQGYTFDESDTPFSLHCGFPGGSLTIAPTEKTKLAQIKPKPATFPLVYRLEADQKPGEIIAEILLSAGSYNLPFYPVAGTGTLTITRFDKGELEATFELDAATIREPPDTIHLVGKIVYHCAGYARCGAG